MISDAALHDLAHQLVTVPGVVGVMLGGSRARGSHTAESDVDLGIYYRTDLDVEALGRLARAVADDTASVSQRGAWGPWVDGGGWLTIDGTAVDWIYRDLNRVESCWQAAQAGAFDFHFQVGHPLGVPDFAYPGELALGVILADPDEELTAVQRQATHYPASLRRALVDRLWEASFAADIARKAVSRGDTAYVAGCLFRSVLLCAHALHGFSGRWLINEKDAIAAAGRLPAAPADFAARAQDLLGNLGGTAAELDRAIDAAEQLISDTARACGKR